VVLISALLVLIFGIYPQPLIDIVQRDAADVKSRGFYSARGEGGSGPAPQLR
jgi:NADH:ubiquinone oxidoreductase subunit 4 (subunit M)